MANLPNIDPQHIPENWRKTAPPQSGGSPVRVYRGFARRVNHHSQSVVRSTDIAAGGILSRDPAAAHDAVYNQYGRDPVLEGDDEGGVVEITIPADLWDELVATHNITERDGYPGFSRRLSTTEIRVNSQEAAQAINRCSRRVIAPQRTYDFRI
jgi:hypothetical protein